MSRIYLSTDRKMIKQLAEDVIANDFPLETVMEMLHSPNAQCSFHCSLLLEALFIKDSALLDPVLERLFRQYSEIKRYSTARSLAKILTNVYRLKAQKQATPKMLEVTDGRYDDNIIDGCFKQLNHKEFKISVSIWQLQLLTFFMNKKNAWVKDEALAVIERIRQIDSPSVVAFTKKYCEKIKSL
jgi:hypothetical protein